MLMCTQGYVKVTPTLNIQNYENIFAVGDITNIDEEKLAQCAEQHAKVVADNINAIELGKEPTLYPLHCGHAVVCKDSCVNDDLLNDCAYTLLHLGI